jgi:hypothetical protein
LKVLFRGFLYGKGLVQEPESEVQTTSDATAPSEAARAKRDTEQPDSLEH